MPDYSPVDGPPQRLSISGIEQTARTLVLEKLYYLERRGIHHEFLRDPKALSVLLPQTVDQIVVRLVGYVFAEKVQSEHVSVEFEYPSSWWQYVRATVRVWAGRVGHRWWLPRRVARWLRCLKVDTLTQVEDVKFEHFVKYPEFVPRDTGARRWEMHIDASGYEDREYDHWGLGKPVSEIRVRGEWTRRIRVRGWWLEDAGQ